ncbi:MAG: ribosome biogenesis GTPase Der [Eubacteriales bacterium]
MAMPIVAIVGRPNVGKSTFFNRITGKRIAIVKDTPGVTRDRIYADAEWNGITFSLVDTGGIDLNTSDVILKQMREQVQIAIDTADVILFFTDAKQGLIPEDYEVAMMLRHTKKPVIVVVNKVDNKKDEQEVYDFYSLGIGEIFGISSAQGLGLGDLLDKIVSYLKDFKTAEQEDMIKIAIVGKPNAGKSSLANRIIGESRSIVSDIPGTTRDAIDSYFTRDDQKYMIIDTAGLRRKSRIEDATIERYSVIRTLAAVKRADVVIIMIDATDGVTEQDVKIAGFVDDEGKPVVIAVNKWDLIDKDTYTVNSFNDKIMSAMLFMKYAQIVYISALSGQRVDKLLDEALNAYKNSAKRLTTGLLNDCINEAITVTQPPSDKGRRLKIYYATQVAVSPPFFVLFVNDEKLVHFSYKRYLENYLRKTFDFKGTPIRIAFREKNE